MRVVLLVILVWISLQVFCNGCIGEEKKALLKIRDSMLAANIDPPESWNNTSTDCCAWERVECDNITKKITHLFLREFGSSYAIKPWNLDFAVFASFGLLKFLDLSYNYFGFSLKSKDFSGMNNLQELHLSFNDLTGQVPLSIQNCTSLRVLDLKNNKLTGSLPESLCDLPFLQSLYVSNNFMTGDIPKYCFTNVTTLEYIGMANNYFTGKFSFLSFANNSMLKGIFLSRNNELRVEFNPNGWVPKFQLEFLMISSCKLNENAFDLQNFVYSQSELQEIDLSNNKLLSNSTKWIFHNKTNLVYANLRNNSLGEYIDLPMHELFSLLTLDLSDNLLEGSIPSNIQLILPNLVQLNLSYNHFTKSIPSSLCNLSWDTWYLYDDWFSFSILDLSNNVLHGDIPSCLMTDSPSPQMLILSNNKLTGNFHNEMHGSSLIELRLNGNMLTGSLPRNFSNYQGLFVLDLHENNLSGHLPESLGMPEIKTLNLGNNYFHGNVPYQFCNLTSLKFLVLADNSLSGPLPYCSKPLNLLFLSLGGNAFTGSLNNFFNRTMIYTLDVKGNHFSGGVHWIGDLYNIRLLILAQNYFEGSLTSKCCQLRNLRLLDLSHNKLSGQIPTCLGNSSLTSQMNNDSDPFWLLREQYELPLHEQNVFLDALFTSYSVQEVVFSMKGNYYRYIGYILGLMVGFDLSDNNFSGEIPQDLGKRTNLKSLNLSYNQLIGHIPETFSNMSQIESLDLSHNRLSGSIPVKLQQLNSLAVFSVAYNNLSGCIPYSNQFSTFNISSYIGNPNLHGLPLDDESCSSVKSFPKPVNDYEDDEVVDNGVMYAIAATSFVFGFWTCIAFLYWSNKGSYLRVRYIDSYVDSFQSFFKK